MQPSLIVTPAISYTVCILSLLSLLFAILGVALPNWIQLLSDDVPPVSVANFGLWTSKYLGLVPSECGSLSSIMRPSEVLCVIGGIVLNLLAFVTCLEANLRNVSSPTNWRRKLLALVFQAATSGLTISGIVIYLTTIYRICLPSGAKNTVGYSLGLMIAATPIAGLAAVFYSVSLGYTLQGKQPKSPVHYVMIGFVALAALFAVVSIATPTWLTSETPSYYKLSLWQRCDRNSSTSQTVCKPVSEEGHGGEFQAAQALAIIALILLGEWKV